ncbi:MAG: MFS transporter [Anaerolineae bacterium]|jgi:DHA1 family multidrug resistance protein-like MFS transporter|nr:MFS transporter [Anaerolineae bacterium]MDX9831066.1 MFS transporter [Anaerolineae bacterium]
MTGSKRKNVVLLSLTLGVVMLGFGMIMPIMPFYVERMGASASELGLLVAISPFIQLVASPLWGGVSDRRGRKPVLAIGLLGYGLSMLFFGLSTELWMLFVARAVGALLSAATMPTTMAYIGDSTSEEERGGGMGALGAATGLGMVLGPALGGLLGSESLSTPFFLTAAVCLLTLLLVLLFLPESLPAEARRQPAAGTRPLRPLRDLWRASFGPLGVLFFLAFLVSFGLTNFQGIFGYYALKKFGYGTEEVGWILAVVGLVAALTQGALTGPLTRRWGEAPVIKATLLASAVTFALLLAARDLTTILITTGLFTLPNALLRPAVISLISRRAGVYQGAAMGLNNSFNSLGRVVGPIWAGFAFDLDYNLPYLSGAIIMAAGFLVSLAFVPQEQAAGSADAVTADKGEPSRPHQAARRSR